MAKRQIDNDVDQKYKGVVRVTEKQRQPIMVYKTKELEYSFMSAEEFIHPGSEYHWRHVARLINES